MMHFKPACIAAGLPTEPRSGWEEALIVAKWPDRYAMDNWDEEFKKKYPNDLNPIELGKLEE